MAYSEGSSIPSYILCLVTGIYPEYKIDNEKMTWKELDDIGELFVVLGAGYREIRVV